MNPFFDTLITIDQIDLLARANTPFVFIDCRYALDDLFRGRKEYLEGHIPDAVYLDVMNDLSSPVIQGKTGRHPLPHPVILENTLQEAGISNADQVVVYDQRNGAYAARAWWLLHWLGHEKAAVLNGGFASWIAAGKPTDNQWTLPEKGTLKGIVNDTMTVTRQELNAPASTLVDSRDVKRYNGETEPIDPVAGHIPGAICIPYMHNTDAEGYWLSKEKLSERFQNIEDPVFYCGSGVTACHNILAYKIATGRMARLYPGSWSEWILHHKPEQKS